jgi:hypothetical protein
VNCREYNWIKAMACCYLVLPPAWLNERLATFYDDDDDDNNNNNLKELE